MKKNLILVLVFFLFSPLNASAVEKLTLMLDWFPNVDHLPLYVAQESGYFKDQDIEVEIISPSETSDALKLAASGQVDLAVSYQPQTLIAADQGMDIRVIAPLVDHPLTTLLFLDKSIQTPADLSGRKIGYTVPGLMDVMLRAFADINQIRNYTPVNVGFTILPSLVSQQVNAVMGPFKTYETVTMAEHGHHASFFELEKYGIPDYEELLFVCGTRTLKKKEKAIKGFVAALGKGLARTRTQPVTSLELYLSAAPQADKTVETKAFELTRPYFAPKIGHDPEKWKEFMEFSLKYGLIRHPVDTAGLIHNWDK